VFKCVDVRNDIIVHFSHILPRRKMSLQYIIYSKTRGSIFTDDLKLMKNV
jgi:hypothetical protein